MKDIKLNMNTNFVKDMHVMLDVNGKQLPSGIFSLLQSKREVGLFCKGIKPNAEWRLKDTKEYYGITGNKHTVLKKINEIYDYFMDDEVKKTEL